MCFHVVLSCVFLCVLSCCELHEMRSINWQHRCIVVFVIMCLTCHTKTSHAAPSEESLISTNTCVEPVWEVAVGEAGTRGSGPPRQPTVEENPFMKTTKLRRDSMQLSDFAEEGRDCENML